MVLNIFLKKVSKCVEVENEFRTLTLIWSCNMKLQGKVWNLRLREFHFIVKHLSFSK